MKRKLSVRQKRAREEWRARFLEWRKSGLSQSRYCNEKGLNLRTFQYWRRKFHPPRQADAQRESNSMVKVVQLQQEKISSRQIDLPRSGSEIKLQVGSIFVELDNNFSQDTLLRLIRVLKAV